MIDLGVNLDNNVANAGKDVELAAYFGAKGVRVSIEQSNSNFEKTLQTYARYCSDHGLWLYQTCQTIGHKAYLTSASIDSYATHCCTAANIAKYTSTGNEDNGFGSKDKIPNAAARAVMLLAVLEKRATMAPGRWIVAPGLCPAGGNQYSTYQEPVDFYARMFKTEPTLLNYKKFMLDMHGYCDGRSPYGTPAEWNTFYEIRAVDALVDNYGKHLKIACSECGTHTGPAGELRAISPQLQVTRLYEMADEWADQEAAGVKHGPIIWFTLRDNPPLYQNGWPGYCGLVDQHGTAKPVAAAFKDLATAA